MGSPTPTPRRHANFPRPEWPGRTCAFPLRHCAFCVCGFSFVVNNSGFGRFDLHPPPHCPTPPPERRGKPGNNKGVGASAQRGAHCGGSHPAAMFTTREPPPNLPLLPTARPPPLPAQPGPVAPPSSANSAPAPCSTPPARADSTAARRAPARGAAREWGARVEWSGVEGR